MLKKYSWIGIVAGILGILATAQALGMVPWVTISEADSKYETKEHAKELFLLIREDLQEIKRALNERGCK